MKINLNNNKKPINPLGNKKSSKNDINNDEIVLDPFAGQTKKSNQKARLRLEKDPIPKQKPSRKEAKERKIKEVSEKVSQPEKKPLRERNIFKKKEKDTSALAPEPQHIVNKQGLRPNNKKFFSLIGLIVGFVVIFLLGTQFLTAMKQIKEGSYLGTQQVMMPDVTGYTEAQAIEKLKKEDINVSVEYMYNKYFPDGTVIKCSVDPNNPVEKGTTVKMYVCQYGNSGESLKGLGVFDKLVLPSCPIEKNSIALTAISVDDVYLNLKFQSKSASKVIAIKYTLGLVDNTGRKVNQEYIIENIELVNGKSVSDKIELTNPDLVEITLEYVQALKVQE